MGYAYVLVDAANRLVKVGQTASLQRAAGKAYATGLQWREDVRYAPDLRCVFLLRSDRRLEDEDALRASFATRFRRLRRTREWFHVGKRRLGAALNADLAQLALSAVSHASRRRSVAALTRTLKARPPRFGETTLLERGSGGHFRVATRSATG